jgi:hypothetical protein
MKEQTKTRWLHVRLSEEEHTVITTYFKNTTCRKLSNYVRLKLLEKPITVTYRNTSFDDFMAEMIRLRADLNAIGNNFNQSVKKLHTLQNPGVSTQWITSYQAERDAMQHKAEIIKNRIEKFAETWLQSSKPETR